MGYVPCRRPYLTPNLSTGLIHKNFLWYTKYNSQGMSRLYRYFSNSFACQSHLQNCFHPPISYAVSISRLSYFIVFLLILLGDGIRGPVITLVSGGFPLCDVVIA